MRDLIEVEEERERERERRRKRKSERERQRERERERLFPHSPHRLRQVTFLLVLQYLLEVPLGMGRASLECFAE